MILDMSYSESDNHLKYLVHEDSGKYEYVSIKFWNGTKTLWKPFYNIYIFSSEFGSACKHPRVNTDGTVVYLSIFIYRRDNFAH